MDLMKNYYWHFKRGQLSAGVCPGQHVFHQPGRNRGCPGSQDTFGQFEDQLGGYLPSKKYQTR
jgi:hypothetical protein